MTRKQTLILWITFMGALYGVFPAFAQDNPPQLLYMAGRIYTVNVDTGRATRLSDRDEYATEPTWSPNGRQIAYTTVVGDDYYGEYGLYVMNADGSSPKLIAKGLSWRSDPVWLNDGSALLYATSTGIKDGSCIIKQVNRDGSKGHEILRKAHSQCSVPNLNPVLSPDGTRLIFGYDEGMDGKYYQLYTLTLADGNVTRLTDTRAANTSPVWSLDGTQIAYVSNQDKQREIYLMNADGSGSRRLTHRPGNDFSPRWLPDGSQIIFASDQDDYNIYSFDVQSGVVRKLTHLVDYSAWSPVVSPDGTQIAYLTGIDPVAGSDHIVVMTLSTGEIHDLSKAGVNAYSLSWRPQANNP